MIRFLYANKFAHVILLIHIIFSSGSALAEEDKRTPLERYQGSYTGAWLLCVLQQKQLFILEKAKQKGVTLDPEFGKDVDIEACKKKGLAEMKKEYLNVVPLINNDEGRAALKEHYVHAIMHIKEIAPRAKEDEDVYTERMNRTFRKSKELYVRFEITQP